MTIKPETHGKCSCREQNLLLADMELDQARFECNLIKSTVLDCNKLNKYRANVSNKALTVLSISSSRHTTQWMDVMHLNTLELRYLIEWDLVNLERVRNITIHNEFIIIWWIKIRRYNELLASTEKETESISIEEITYFQYNRAQELASQKWLQILDLEDFSNLFELMPWDNDDKIFSLINILNFRFNWIYSFDLNSFYPQTHKWYVWLRSENINKLSWLEFEFRTQKWLWWLQKLSSFTLLQNICSKYGLSVRFIYK